jgi:hypothetical protein
LNAFSDMLQVLYSNEDIAHSAWYTSVATGTVKQVRVIAARPDTVETYGNIQRIMEQNLYRIRRSELPEPAEGDVLDYEGELLTLSSWVADSDRAEWIMGFE